MEDLDEVRGLGKLKALGGAKLTLILSALMSVILIVTGVVLTAVSVNAANTTMQEAKIAELSGKLDGLHEEESKALAEGGFSDAYYAALANTSVVIDEIDEAEHAIDNTRETYKGPWDYVTKNGAVWYFVGAVAVIVIGVLVAVFMKSKEMSGWVGPAVMGMCVLCTVGSVLPVWTKSVYAVRNTTGTEVTLIGDSLSENAVKAGSYMKFLPDADIYAKGGKHFYYTIWDDNKSGIEILKNEVIAQGKLREILVFELGSNDIAKWNPNIPENRRNEGITDLRLTEAQVVDVIDTAMAARSDVKIIFYTGYARNGEANGYDFSGNNAVLSRVASQYENVYLGDWVSEAEKYGETIFSDSDGLHPIAGTGTDVFASFIQRTINSVPQSGSTNPPTGFEDSTLPGNGSLDSISFDEFKSKYGSYIMKLVPGSDAEYKKVEFQNSAESHAKFELASGGEVEVYEDEVGFNCSIKGVMPYMIDFTNASENKRGEGGFLLDYSSAGNISAGADDKRSRAAKAAMLQNTLLLQLVEYCGKGRGISVKIPKGEYYFAVGHRVAFTTDKGISLGAPHVIYPVDGVSISGYGIGPYKSAISSVLGGGDASQIDAATNSVNGTNATILKPYTKASYGDAAAPDMFRFNDIADANYDLGHANFLRNVSYRSFIVDGAEAVGLGYTTAGKGFMYNLFENVNWDNMVVRNTDGTGFGIDLPAGSSSYITNSLALNNGKKAKSSDGNAGGASGFGIGTGYGDNEKFKISNCVSYGNSKFGFFFEHQNRFKDPGSNIYPYDAIMGAGNSQTVGKGGLDTSSSKKAFVVTGSVAISNLYNFGGMRAYDMDISNSTSIAGSVSRNQGRYYAQTTTTENNIFFTGDSRRVDVSGVKIQGGLPSDLTQASTWAQPAIVWAYQNGISYGVSGGSFGPKQQIRRQDAVTMIWRMMGQPGEVITRRNGNQPNYPNHKSWNVQNCFGDVPADSYYAGAIKWAHDDRKAQGKSQVVVGAVACSDGSSGTFNSNKPVSREEFVTMLWRLAGEPDVGTKAGFSDVEEGAYYEKAVNWAVAKGITSGVGDNKFGITKGDNRYDCTREQAVTMLYRYYGKYGKK